MSVEITAKDKEILYMNFKTYSPQFMILALAEIHN